MKSENCAYSKSRLLMMASVYLRASCLVTAGEMEMMDQRLRCDGEWSVRRCSRSPAWSPEPRCRGSWTT